MTRQEISDDVCVIEPLMPTGTGRSRPWTDHRLAVEGLKQWRRIAMRSDKLFRSYRAAVSLAATLIWIRLVQRGLEVLSVEPADGAGADQRHGRLLVPEWAE